MEARRDFSASRAAKSRTLRGVAILKGVVDEGVDEAVLEPLRGVWGFLFSDSTGIELEAPTANLAPRRLFGSLEGVRLGAALPATTFFLTLSGGDENK